MAAKTHFQKVLAARASENRSRTTAKESRAASAAMEWPVLVIVITLPVGIGGEGGEGIAGEGGEQIGGE